MPLPPPAPYTLSALDALAAFRAGTLTPSALLESCLERIAATNGRLNAYVALHPAEALRELARQKDAELQRAIAEGTADTLPALFGLPVGVKDLTETAGLKTTFGSLLFENYVPGSDADIVKRVKEAGGIVVGKSNTPEFGGASFRGRLGRLIRLLTRFVGWVFGYDG